ncbi:MAG: tetratricopeptide repeat protein [Bacteroidales bacterium]|nr:tetratricopeptide repeat protein [Bacteroidales bacterium]
MKRIALVLALACGVAFSGYAQKGKVALSKNFFASNKIDMAKKLIDEAMTDESCADYAQGHFMLGQIYQACIENGDPGIRNMVAASDVNKVWEAYQNVERLDEKGKYAKKLGTQYKNLYIDFQNYGIEEFNVNNFADAFKAFETTLEIGQNKYFKATVGDKVDTTILYFAGLAAHQAEDYVNAEKYYKQLLPYNFKSEDVYEMLSNVLKLQEKEEEAVKYMTEGIKKFPNNNYMLVEMINYYLDSENPADAIPYLDEAIASNPTSIAFIRSKANIYDKIKNYEEAIKLYNQVLSIDPNDFYSIYAIGVIELEKVNAYQAEVQDISDFKKYEEAMKDVYKRYQDVVVYFEKAHKIDSDDRNTMITMKEIYYKLRNIDDKYEGLYNEINEKLKR